MSDKKAELQKYLVNNVNPIIKVLIRDILDARTDEVVDFMKEWCESKGRSLENNLKEKHKQREHLSDSEQSDSEKEDEVMTMKEIEMK